MKVVTALAVMIAVVARTRFVIELLDPATVRGDLTNSLVGCVAVLWMAVHLLVSGLRREQGRDHGRGL